LRTSECEDGEGKPSKGSAEKGARAAICGGRGRASHELGREIEKEVQKWSTIFVRLPINYRLYEWVDPRFAPQWKKSHQGVVYLETSSPIRANHTLKKFIVFQKAQYTTEDWIRYIAMFGDFRFDGGTLTANELSRASESQNIGTIY
jgi:hypothetical protein